MNIKLNKKPETTFEIEGTNYNDIIKIIHSKMNEISGARHSCRYTKMKSHDIMFVIDNGWVNEYNMTVWLYNVKYCKRHKPYTANHKAFVYVYKFDMQFFNYNKVSAKQMNKRFTIR